MGDTTKLLKNTTMKNIKILSRHNNLEDAIAEAGGLNREFNPTVFDQEVETVKNQAAVQEFLVIEYCGRKEVLYTFQCDIRLLNKFNAGGGCISNTTIITWMIDNELCNIQSIHNNDKNRKLLSRIQKRDNDLYVLNI